MKRFKLHGDTAYWNGLKVNALNLSTLNEEKTSPIPEGKRMYVNVVDNLYRDESARKEYLCGEISEDDKDCIRAILESATPDFLLTLDGKVVGYANLSHRHGRKEDTTGGCDAPIDIFAGIVDTDTLTLLHCRPTEKPEPKKEYIVRHEVTITTYEKVSATSEEDAKRNALDIFPKVEAFIEENFPDDEDGNFYVDCEHCRTATEI